MGRSPKISMRRHQLRLSPAILVMLAGVAIVVSLASILTSPFREERFLQHASFDQLVTAAHERPGSARVSYYLGCRAAQKGQFQIADNAFAHAATLAPDEEDTWLAWAKLMSAQGQSLKATAILKMYLRGHRAGGDLHYQLGLFQQAEQADLAAYAEAKQAAALLPNDPKTWRLVGEEALKLHRDQDAEPALRRAIALTPDDWLSRVRLGHVLSDEGRNAEAESLCRQAVEQAPRESITYLALGTVLLSRAQTRPQVEEACRDFQRATELAPAVSEGYLLLGRCESREAAWASAKRVLEKASQLDPNNPEVHYELARVYRMLGDRAGMMREIGLHRSLQEADNRKQSLLARFRNAHDLAAGRALTLLLAASHDPAAPEQRSTH